MKTKLSHLVVQGFLVDEDDDGEVIGHVELQAVKLTRRGIAEHLRSIEQLCATRTAELEAAKPNRAARRARQPRKGGKR